MSLKNLEPGIILGRRFEITDVLHRGESFVALVRDVPVGDRCVLKVVSGRDLTSGRPARLASEFRLLSDIKARGFVDARDFGTDSLHDVTWLSMEQAKGTPLSASGFLDAGAALRVAAAVLRALTELHDRGLAHLDLKPSNIMVDNNADRVTLIDLDLATDLGGAGRGTVAYAAPESYVGRGSPDRRADFWSLAVTLVEAMTGEIPRAPQDWKSAGMGRLAPFLEASLQLDPSQRPADAYAALRLLGLPWGEPPRSRPPWVRRGMLLDRVMRSFPLNRHEHVSRAVPLVALRGPRGCGKSRVVSKAASQLAALGFRILNIGPRGVSEKWATLGAIHRLLAQLAVSDPSKPESVNWLDELSQRDRGGVFDRTADAVLRVARHRRTVIVVDDLDLVDETSREFLGHLFRHLADAHDERRPGSVVQALVAYDPTQLLEDSVRQWIEGESSVGASTVIPVLSMSGLEARQLARLAAPDFDDPAALDTLVAESGGNPKAIVEGLSLMHRGASLADALASQGRLVARTESIPDSARGALHVLAHAVVPLRTDVLASILGDSALEALGLLESLGEVVATAMGWTLVDVGLAHHIANPRDRSLDASLAVALEAHRAEHHAVVIHRLLGGLLEGTFDAALAEVHKLRAKGSEVELNRLLETMISEAHSSRFVVRSAALALFDLRLAKGQVSLARQTLVHAVGTYPSLDPALAVRMARASMRDGDPVAARREIELVLNSSALLSSAERSELTIELAELLLGAGRPAESRAVLSGARSWAETAVPMESVLSVTPTPIHLPRLSVPPTEHVRAARYLIVLGELERVAGRVAAAIACQTSAVDLAASLAHIPLLAKAAHCEGSAYLAAGDLDNAERAFLRALPLRKDHCDLLGQADTANNLGVVYRRQGRGSEAIEQFSVSLRLRRQAGHVAGEGSSFLSLANVHFERRELKAAARNYRRALALYRRIGDLRGQAMVQNNLGAVLHLQGIHDEAARSYAEAERLDREIGDIPGALVRRINLADLWITMGDFESARHAIRVVLRVESRRGSTLLTSRCALLEARVALATGDVQLAESLAKRGCEIAMDDDLADFKLIQAECWFLLGRVVASYELAHSVIIAMPAIETRAYAAEILGRAAAAAGESPCREVIPLLVEAARATEKHGLLWARFRSSRGLGAAFRRLDESYRARAALHDAFEALERVAHGLDVRGSLERWLNHPDVQSFGREVAALSAEVTRSRPRVEDAAVTGFLRDLKDGLFEANRALSPLHRQRGEGLRGVLEVAKGLAAAETDSDLHVLLCDGLVELFRAERAFLILVDERRRPRVGLARNSLREPVDEPETQISRRIVDETLAGQVGMRFDNAMADGTLTSAASVASLELRSVMAAPILRHGVPMGLLYVDHRLVAGHFSESDLEILEALASQAAVALDRARLENERRRNESLKLVGDLAGGVAHDFNNLLAAILGRAHEIRSFGIDAELVPALSTIEKAARDGARVVRRLQDFARTSRDVSLSPLSIRGVLEDVREFTRHRWEGDARRQGITFDVAIEGDASLMVQGDAAELREVFTNLALNSLKAMPGGGSLTFVTEVRGPNVVVTVADTGLGMTEDVREHVFDPYFTTSSDGAGLGMSIVLGIVSRHQGEIEVDSRVGGGTRIFVTLRRSTSTEECEDGGVVDAPPLRGTRALVVDDEPSVRAVIVDVLSEAGVEVAACENGPEALRRISPGSVDFVMTDLGMLPMNGFELAAAIRNVDHAVALVLVTGWGSEVDRSHVTRREIDIVLNKPFEMPALLDVARRAVELTRLRRATRSDLT